MRNLINVVESILDYIPEMEINFRKAMRGVMKEELYRAPEAQDWDRAATLLSVYMREFESNEPGHQWKEDWCEVVIKIWKDEI